jgi:hypothetical protein
VWDRILKMAKESSGTVTFPMSKAVESDDVTAVAQVAGCDLLRQTPEIKNWVASTQPGKRLVIGGYAYLDGAKHVQVCLRCGSSRGGLCAVCVAHACVRDRTILCCCVTHVWRVLRDSCRWR